MTSLKHKLAVLLGTAALVSGGSYAAASAATTANAGPGTTLRGAPGGPGVPGGAPGTDSNEAARRGAARPTGAEPPTSR